MVIAPFQAPSFGTNLLNTPMEATRIPIVLNIPTHILKLILFLERPLKKSAAVISPMVVVKQAKETPIERTMMPPLPINVLTRPTEDRFVRVLRKKEDQQ